MIATKTEWESMKMNTKTKTKDDKEEFKKYVSDIIESILTQYSEIGNDLYEIIKNQAYNEAMILSLDNIENSLSYVLETNRYWNLYYLKYYKEYYSNENLILEIETAKKEILKLKKENSEILEENIELGERIEKMKDVVKEIKIKNNEIQKENNEFRNNKNIFKRTIKTMALEDKAKKLEIHNLELSKRLNWSGRSALSDEIVKQIILMSKKMSQKEISEKLNISTATVSRYIQKYEKNKLNINPYEQKKEQYKISR